MCFRVSFYIKIILYFIRNAFLALEKAQNIFHIWTTPCFLLFVTEDTNGVQLFFSSFLLYFAPRNELCVFYRKFQVINGALLYLHSFTHKMR